MLKIEVLPGSFEERTIRGARGDFTVGSVKAMAAIRGEVRRIELEVEKNKQPPQAGKYVLTPDFKVNQYGKLELDRGYTLELITAPAVAGAK